jgi:hypothetical protein
MLPGDVRTLFNEHKFRTGDQGCEDGDEGCYFHSRDKDLVVFLAFGNSRVKKMSSSAYNNKKKRGRVIIDLTLDDEDVEEVKDVHECVLEPFPVSFSPKKHKVETEENVNRLNVEALAYCLDLYNECEAWKILDDADRLLCF